MLDAHVWASRQLVGSISTTCRCTWGADWLKVDAGLLCCGVVVVDSCSSGHDGVFFFINIVVVSRVCASIIILDMASIPPPSTTH